MKEEGKKSVFNCLRWFSIKCSVLVVDFFLLFLFAFLSKDILTH